MNTERPAVAAGALVAAIGGAVALGVFLQPERLRAPAWVAYLVALAFIFAGCTIVARVRGHRVLQAWLPVVVLACMVAVPVWLALGGGTRRCIFSASRWIVTLLGRHTDWVCRGAFGIAALIGIAILLLAVQHAIRTTREGRAP